MATEPKIPNALKRGLRWLGGCCARLPPRDARHYLVTGWHIRKPMAEWKRDDFYGHSGELADENAFRAKVLENVEHQREKVALCRREERSRASTPWGPSQGATVYADGVVFHSTAGHGGFLLSADRNRKVHPSIRVVGAAYAARCARALTPLRRKPDLCRVVLRLRRSFVFPAITVARVCRWAVSYQDSVLHSGNLYRFDGWARSVDREAGPIHDPGAEEEAR